MLNLDAWKLASPVLREQRRRNPSTLPDNIQNLYIWYTFYKRKYYIMIWPFKPSTRKQIARIEINGAIASGTREKVLKALEEVQEKKYPVLLLRIDSPGGTVADSHEIYCALKRLQDKKIKVIASFGNISASGGVYISAGATHIVSNPGTITGSVGVIIRGNNLEKLLDKVGVSFQVIKSGPYKDILSFDRQLSPEEEGILQNLIDSSYEQFVKIIAQNRNLTVEKVKEFADGRIFTGEQALELGMVDRLGTEEDARLWACELVGLDPDKTECHTIEEPKSLVDRVLNRSQTKSKISTAINWLEFELATNGQPLWLYRP